MRAPAQLRTWLAPAGLVLTIAIWSGHATVAKIIMREASPMLVAQVRFTLAGLFFFLPVFITLHRGEQRFSRSDWIGVLLLGVGGVGGSMLFYLLGLQTTPATDAAIYNLTTPLFVLVLARVWFGERLTVPRVLGIAVAFCGAAILVTGGSVGLGGGDLRGALYILVSALLWAGYTLLSKSLLARRSPLLVLAAASLAAMVAVWPMSGVFGVWAELPRVLTWSPTAWLIMLYLVVLMSMVSQWLYVLSIRDLHTSQVSALLYSGPFFTAVIAGVVLDERPTAITLLAGLLILGGVWLVNRPARTRLPAATPTPAAGAEVAGVSSKPS
jgi:drug/metabolite transporter (DMT)-like permease